MKRNICIHLFLSRYYHMSERQNCNGFSFSVRFSEWCPSWKLKKSQRNLRKSSIHSVINHWSTLKAIKMKYHFHKTCGFLICYFKHCFTKHEMYHSSWSEPRYTSYNYVEICVVFQISENAENQIILLFWSITQNERKFLCESSGKLREREVPVASLRTEAEQTAETFAKRGRVTTRHDGKHTNLVA